MIVRPLTEYCTLNMGQSPDSKTYNTQGEGLPFYQGNADFGETHPITRVWCSAPVKVAEDGDILISVRAPIGAMNMAVERCCIGRGLAALTPIRSKCSRQFLYYALQSKVDTLIAQGTGSTFKAISKKVLEATCIPAYSTVEQEQIAETIGRVDNAIAARRNQLLLLDQLVKSRFIELFIGKGYPIRTINEVSLGKGEYGAQSASTEYDPKRPRYVRITDINDDGTLNDDVVVSINPDDDKQYRLEYGDFMFARMGATVGKTYAFISGNQIFAGYLIRYKLNQKLINPRYLFWYTKLDEYWNWVKLNQSGAAQPGINAQKYGALQIPVPPIELQEQFAAFVEQTDKSKYYSSLSFRYCQAAANTYRQEWMTCRTSDF